jgi:hypothetical protein
VRKRWRGLLPAVLVGAALLASPAAAVPIDGPATASDAGCFGAAARDPDRPACRGTAAATKSVTPSPAEALDLPNSPCERQPARDGPPVCAFGAAPDAATRTIALVGDSHAGHWRAALAVVAERNGWRGLSLTHSSCPLQVALRDLKEPRRAACRRWKQQVFAWFEHHPEIHTVFVAGLTGGSGVVPEGGRSAFATAERGYERAWAALLSTVANIVVIRDTPKFRADTNRCVERAVQAKRQPKCALARGQALDPDPAIAAARRLASSRVLTVDLTRYFCDRRECFPVIGGALVLRDNTHVTGIFSATLGPYLERAVDRLALG